MREAKYIGLAITVQKNLAQLLYGMDNREYSVTTIYGDNRVSIASTKNPVNRWKPKHIDVWYYFIWEGTTA